MGSDDEDADMKLILHAADVTARGETSTMICSPDTYVLVLVVRRYPELCEDTTFVTRRKSRIIQFDPIYEALGPQKAAALPGHEWQ